MDRISCCEQRQMRRHLRIQDITHGGRIEIACFTFPESEGQSIATSVARRLVAKAISESQSERILAQTLPERNASSRVLEKLGFQQITEIDHPEDGRVWAWELRTQPRAAPDAFGAVEH